MKRPPCYRHYDKASDLLANEPQRLNCERVLRRGGTYYRGPARRETIMEAVRYLKERQARRRQRAQPEVLHIPSGDVQMEEGRILRLQQERLSQRLARGETLPRKTVMRLYQQRRLVKLAKANVDNTRSLVRSVVRVVGRIGEQCEADLRHFEGRERFSGKWGCHHRLDRSELARVQMRSDGTAALITMRDYCSFGSGSRRGEYQTRRGCSYRCYLVVRDATSGEAHILRVPPRFGNDNTQFFYKFSCVEERIQAAIAWTFGVRVREYRPAVEA